MKVCRSTIENDAGSKRGDGHEEFGGDVPKANRRKEFRDFGKITMAREDLKSWELVNYDSAAALADGKARLGEAELPNSDAEVMATCFLPENHQDWEVQCSSA